MTNIYNEMKRHFLGYDSMLNMMEFFPKHQQYPPQNIYKTSKHVYVIEMALAGWDKKDLTVEQSNDTLIVKSNTVIPDKKTKQPTCLREEDGYPFYYHTGISNRKFKVEYKIVKTAEVTDVKMENGLLTITIVNEPEKPGDTIKSFPIG